MPEPVPNSARVDDLAAGETRCFSFRDGLGLDDEAFVLRRRDGLQVYVNRCPHWKTPLDAGGGYLYDQAGDAIVCHRHGARFDPESGVCLSGPADGPLVRLPFDVVSSENGERVVVEPPAFSEDAWMD